MGKGIFLDAKIDYPAACNAMDSSGILWGNESLAGLLALELKPDHLFLFSVDLKTKFIHTYVKEKHQGEITFGDKSRVGKGGATSTVNAAVRAAYGGFPVVITSYALLFHCASGSDGQTRGHGGLRQVAAGARGNRGGQRRKRSREDAQGGDRGKGRGRGQGAPARAGVHGGPSKGRGISVYKLETLIGTVWMNECRNVGNLFASIQALRRVEWCDHMDFDMLDGTTFDEQGVVNAGWNIVRRNLVQVQVTSEDDVEFDYGAAAAGDDVVRVTVKRELLKDMEVLNAYLLSVSYMKPTDCYRFWCGQLDAGTIVYTFQVADPDGGALENLDRNDFNHRTSTQADWYEVVGRRLRTILARW